MRQVQTRHLVNAAVDSLLLVEVLDVRTVYRPHDAPHVVAR